jgi:hypothetical protein
MRRCPHCLATIRQHRSGKARAGSQRLRCMYCLQTYTPNPKRRGSAEKARQQALETPVDRGKFLSVPRQPDVAVPFVENEADHLSNRANVGAKIQFAQELPVELAVQENRPFVVQVAQPASTHQKWGLLPEIAVFQAVSLLLIAWAYVIARAGTAWSEVCFWIGLAMLIVPVAMRLYATGTARYERIALLLLLGGAFYLVKVMHSPHAFTYPDEFSQLRNVREILETHLLFQNNPDLPATAFYPGLATITSLLISLSGLSPFAAGLLIIGSARLVLFLALFLLYEQVSGSARIGSLATLFYMGNANFLFFTAAFSYEPLALPIAILVLYIVARREMTNVHRTALTVVALLGVLMVVISHHMTSYVLTVLLFAATGISILRTRGRQRGPWDLALIAALAVSSWLVFVASYTVHYLSPVLWKALHSMVRLAMQEEPTRQLFKSTSTGYVSPLWLQLTVLCSIMIIASGLPIGWLNIWRRYRHQIFVLFLAVIAFAYLPMQALRLTSSGWETGNRSSAFIFIGVGFVLALAVDYIGRFAWHVKSFFGKFVPRSLRRFTIRMSGRHGVGRLREFVTNLGSLIQRKSTWIHAAIVVVLIFGGFMSGWPPQARMPRPYLVGTGGSHLIEPQVVEVAKWTHDFLGPDHRIATSKVGDKLFSAYGGQTPFTGKPHGIKAMLFSAAVGPSEREIIRNAGIEYIAYDRRSISWDLMIGLYFFNQKSSPSYELIEFETYEKFDGLQGVNRVMDSGDIVIYDVRVYLATNEAFRSEPTAGAESTPAVEAHIDQPGSVDQISARGNEIEEKHPISITPDGKRRISMPSVIANRAGRYRPIVVPVFGR